LNKKQLSRLKEELNNTEGFNSYKEIQIWIKKELKVDIPYDTMWNLVRKRLKAKLKTPRPVNINKDLVKEEAFKKTLLMS
jgi:transposase